MLKEDWFLILRETVKKAFEFSSNGRTFVHYSPLAI